MFANYWAKKQVRKTARMLDELNPGWAYKVDTETLDLRSGVNCILGQVFRDEALPILAYSFGAAAVCEKFGSLPSTFFSNTFRPAWIKEIQARTKEPVKVEVIVGKEVRTKAEATDTADLKELVNV